MHDLVASGSQSGRRSGPGREVRARDAFTDSDGMLRGLLDE